jgi:integrase
MQPEAYFNNGCNPEQDLHDFKNYLKAKGLAPKSVETKLGGVFSYFLANRVITRELWKELNLANQSKVQDKVPTATELKQIIQCTDIRGKALFLTLVSSGMRLQDALSIILDDIFFDNLNKNPPRIWLHCHKVNTDYWAFLTDEARDSIKAWLKVRSTWLQQAFIHSQKRGINKKQKDDRLFPFSEQSANVLWNNALRNAGLTVIDNNTKQKRRTIHIHTLRKFNRVTTGMVLSHDVCEALLCHLTGMTKIYFRPDGDNQLAKEYTKVMNKLRIITIPIQDTDTATTIDSLKQRLESQERIIQQLIRQTQLNQENLEIQQLQQADQTEYENGKL